LFRYNNACQDACPINYKKNSVAGSQNHECVPESDCNGRVPFSNGSCSIKEDFDEGNPVSCYYYIENNGNIKVEKCIPESECSGALTTKVFFLFYFVYLLKIEIP
jgi:hypothetical protein